MACLLESLKFQWEVVCVSLIVSGMSFSKHPVTFEMLSRENVAASTSPPGEGEGFPNSQMPNDFHTPALVEGQFTHGTPKLEKPSLETCAMDYSSC